MVNVQFGTTDDDERRITKAFTPNKTVSCYCKEPVDYFNPTFVLDYTVNYNSYNYCYVPAWNKYYFINSIVLAQGGKSVIQCTEDVLKTFETELLQVKGTVERTGDLNYTDSYLADDVPMKQYSRDFVLEFNTPFEDQDMIYVLAL